MPMLAQALVFLIKTSFGLYLFALMLRLLLQIVRADFQNPIAQSILQLTDPLLRPLRRYIPGYGGQDWAIWCAMVGLEWLQAILVSFLLPHAAYAGSWWTWPWHAAVSVVQLGLTMVMWGIIARSILTMVAAGVLFQTPIGDLLCRITDPVLEGVKKYFPASLEMGGIDFTPWVACVGLGFLHILLG